MVELMKDNSKTLLYSLVCIVKTATRYSSSFFKPNEFKPKLVSLLCDQIELQASKLLEARESAVSSTDAKLIKFFIEKLLEFAAAYQNEYFGGGPAMIELLFWLLKVENTASVSEEKIALIHRSITVGLMGILKLIYADKSVFDVSYARLNFCFRFNLCFFILENCKSSVYLAV